MSLYNCKSEGSNYRISKFSNDLEVEASYLTSNDGCECPAGHRPACRHRTMLPCFIAKDATAGQWFHNYEANQWVRAASDDEPDTLGDLASAASEVAGPDDNYSTGSMMEAVYELRANQAKNITPQPINLLELAKPSLEIVTMITLPDDSTPTQVAEAFAGLQPKPLRRL